MDNDLKLNALPELFRSEIWTWAKTMPGIPHEYIVRGKCRMSDEQFAVVVRMQRELGKHEVWGRYYFPYLYVDGYKYWTMGDPVEETIILNRQKVFGEFDSLNQDLISMDSCDEVLPQLHEWYRGQRIFDVGCGEGRLLNLLPIPTSLYRGCDPSRLAVERFQRLHPDYVQGLFVAAFEECYSRWIHSDEAFVALYGSPSYIMLPYLKMVAASVRPLFLMFYRDGYRPEGLQYTHAFDYTLKELEALFGSGVVRALGNYWVVIR
jgi:SAM-dependent methyltransferase